MSERLDSAHEKLTRDKLSLRESELSAQGHTADEEGSGNQMEFLVTLKLLSRVLLSSHLHNLLKLQLCS